MTDSHLFWIASRASGTVALLLASAAVAFGLMQGMRLIPRATRDLRPLHEALSLATMAAIAVHAVTLLGDSYLSPSVADLTIPFVSSYQRAWTTLGIVAGWGLIALGLSYYHRARIGVARWRRLHRFTALFWLAGLAHSLGEGTDGGQAWFLAAVAIAVAPPLVLLLVRPVNHLREGIS
jgi:methionine sulfoxide reductase heme-binding subunit